MFPDRYPRPRLAAPGVAALALLLAAVPAFASPDTMVVKKGDAFAPGAAASWKAEGDSVTFTLAAGVDAASVATTLGDRLATATVTVQGGAIKITGVPANALLEQLSTLSLSGEGADPLAALAGIGPGVAMDNPEGGGSIRASRPSATARPRIIKEHDPKERVVAEVVKVERGAFPEVTLTLKVRSNAKEGPLKKELRKGKTVHATVVMTGDAGGPDFAAAATQRNLAAYYLGRGDQVTVHAVPGEGGAVEIDFVERAVKD